LQAFIAQNRIRSDVVPDALNYYLWIRKPEGCRNIDFHIGSDR